MYVSSLITIPFVLSKIWPRQVYNMEKKWLRGDNYVNIQVRIRVLVGPSTDCHLSINQVSFQFLLYFSRYGPDRAGLQKKHFSWTSPEPVAFENGHALICFRQARKKNHFTKSHIKILLVNKL